MTGTSAVRTSEDDRSVWKADQAQAAVDVHDEITELLFETTRQLPLNRGRDEPVNLTESLLVHIADTAGAPTSRATVGLERLCRKVDIAKTVRRSYDATWNKPVDRTPISAEAWAALTAALLYRAAYPLRTDRVERRGESLRFLNSAFNALDLYEAAGGYDVSVLRECGTRLLDRVTLADRG